MSETLNHPATRRPSVRFVSLYYWPDEGAVPQILTELAEACASGGFDVEVVTSRGTYRRADDRPLACSEVHNGVAIRRVWSTAFGRRTLLRRATDYLSFTVSALVSLLTARAVDVLVVVSSPPVLPPIGALIRRLRGGRLVYKVEDLYPDLAIALGVLEPGLLTLVSRFSARLAVRAADVVVAIDSYMVPRLRESGARRIECIGNWANAADFNTTPRGVEQVRREFEIEGRFVVLYAGNFGLAHTFTGILAAAERLSVEAPHVRFVFVGDGVRRPQLAAAAARLPNVRLEPFQPRQRIGAVHAAADVLLVTLKPEANGLVAPSKYFAALAAGRPVMFVGQPGSEAVDHIRDNDLGWVVPDDGEAIAAAVVVAAADRDAGTARGVRARTLFERDFSRERVTDEWLRLLATVAG